MLAPLSIFSVAAWFVALAGAYNVPGSPGHAAQFYNCVNPGQVALTFDDGPGPYLYDISKALIEAGGKGTFFFSGNYKSCIYTAENQKRVKYAVQKGHQVASHTWSHPNLVTLNKTQIREEFRKIDEAIERISGVRPAFMRPPDGEGNADVTAVAYERKQSVVYWYLDFLEFYGNGATNDQITSLYSDLINDPSLTTLLDNGHEDLRTAHQLLPAIIKIVKKRGWKLVTVAECVNLPAYSHISALQKPNKSWKC